MILLHCPCHLCHRRTLGCHARCLDYADYRRRVNKLSKAIKLDNEVDDARRQAVINATNTYKYKHQRRKK